MQKSQNIKIVIGGVALFQIILTVIWIVNLRENGMAAWLAGIAFGIFSIVLDVIIYRFFQTVQGKVGLEEEIKQLYQIRANELDYGDMAGTHIRDVERLSEELGEKIRCSMEVLAGSADAKSGHTEVEELLRGMEQSIQSCRFVRYCDHAVCNSLLDAKVQAAASIGLTLKTDCRIPQTLHLDEYEACSLLDNMISAAISHYTQTAQDNSISVAADVRSGKLVVRVTGHNGLTKGTRCPELAMVQKLVDKYNGLLEIQQEDGLTVITAVV